MLKAVCAAAALLALGQAADLFAQGYPERPVRLIIPLAAGGSADIVGRLVAQKLGEKLGQQFVVDNRPGASGIIGAEIAARAPRDGYTLLLAGSSFVIAPSLQRKLPYDPLKDFAPITMAANSPGLLVVNPALPVRTVKDLIAVARAKPGQLNYGSPGNGTSPHFAGALFNMMAGTEMVHVPYKGAAMVMTDLIGGQIHVSFASMLSAITHAKSGRLRAVAVTGAKRSAALPELPAVAEFVPGFESGSWQLIFAPAGTPAPIIGTLHREIVRVVHLPEVVAQLARDGAEPVGNTPQELSNWLPGEFAKWAKVARTARMHIE
ncbi:MAG: tripartite tricarboxylate transporter substrate binding protein [Betaproteobacteria bacterium]|nr:tripartite tricarboxylate transporter substrate binding protein [Betaproteobacteria bacterium]